VIDDADGVAEALGFFHVMRGVDDGRAFGAEGLDHFEDAVTGLRIDAYCGLVEHNEAGAMNEACCHIEPALHTSGKGFDQGAGSVGKGRPFEAPGDRVVERFAAQALIAAEGVKILPAGEERVDSQFLRNPSEVGAGGSRADGVTEDADAAGVRSDTPHDAADECRFACAVGAEKAEAGAGQNFEGDSVDRGDRTETLPDGVDKQRRRGNGTHTEW